MPRQRPQMQDSPALPQRFRPEADSHWAINTTIRCQHRCIYCFEGDRRGLKDVPAAETRRLIDRAAGKVPFVIFMGAEPTLNPELPGLIRYARRRGLKANISTNAMRLADPDYLRTLAEAGLSGLELSFHYPDAAVYSRITRAAPSGFARLLKALENVALWQERASEPGERWLNVNLVVSRLNIERLDEIFAHLERRLDPSRYTVSCKRLDASHLRDRPELHRSLYVPLAALRGRLPGLARRIDSGVKVAFRDFPLCAIPGLERHNFDLGYWLSRVRVAQNFRHQESMADMYPKALESEAHPFDWLCADCGLAPLCLQRRLFADAEPRAEHAPRPLLRRIPRGLEAWVLSHPRGAQVLSAARRPAGLGRALAGLLGAAAGPGAPAALWAQLRAGARRLSPDRRETLAALARDAGLWRIFSDRGRAPARARRAQQRLARELDRLPPADAPRTTAAPAGSPPPILARAFPIEPEQGVGPAEGRLPAGWDRFVSGTWLRLWRRAAGREPALAGAELEAAPGGRVLVRMPGGEGEFRIAPAAGPRTPGFLCGPLRVGVAWSGDPKLGRLWLKAAHAACPGLPRRDGTFLAKVWDAFGSGLLPRLDPALGLLGGWVADDGLRLDLLHATGGSTRYHGPCAVLLRPSQDPGGIALQYSPPVERFPDGPWKDLVGGFARTLAAAKRPAR